MNREIKFRVWDKILKCWGEPDKFLGFSMTGRLLSENQLYPTDSIVSQFTGLKDKNGKEIYEGDILQDGNRKYQVIFSIDAFVGEGLNVFSDTLLLGDINDEVSIIGNIFENPELLK